MTLARVVVRREYGMLVIEELTLPGLAPHQVEVELLAAGIQRRHLDFVLNAGADAEPRVPGAEGVGIVTAVAPEVTRAAVGDLVLIFPVPARGVQRAPACPRIEFGDGAIQADQPISTWATNALVDEMFVSVVTCPTADRESLAVIGTNAMNAVAAVTRGANLRQGESIAVFGCGCAGLVSIAAAKQAGAGRIIAVGTAAGLERAATLGATDCLSPAEAAELAPGSVDHVVDCRAEYAGEAAANLTRTGGSAHLIWSGAPDGNSTQDETPVDGFAVIEADRDLDLATLMDWIAREQFLPSLLVSRRYTVEQINEAVAELEQAPVSGQPIMVLEPIA